MMMAMAICTAVQVWKLRGATQTKQGRRYQILTTNIPEITNKNKNRNYVDPEKIKWNKVSTDSDNDNHYDDNVNDDYNYAGQRDRKKNFKCTA